MQTIDLYYFITTKEQKQKSKKQKTLTAKAEQI